jgi:hypothetical protein
MLLQLKDFTSECNAANGFFSTNKPDVIMKNLLEKMDELSQKSIISETNWRVNIEVSK